MTKVSIVKRFEPIFSHSKWSTTLTHHLIYEAGR
jgi:hypothetical protein